MWNQRIALGVACALATFAPAGASAQATPEDDQAKIASATSAAPAEIAQAATVKDWPATEGGELRTVRQGTNDWVCLPDFPMSKGNDPMCLDRTWQAWLPAFMAKKNPPRTSRTGIGYMLTGDAEGSNTDPFATGPTPQNQWHTAEPHVMMLVPDPKQLEGIADKPQSGAPYVMWKGTAYVHLMVPVSASDERQMK